MDIREGREKAKLEQWKLLFRLDKTAELSLLSNFSSIKTLFIALSEDEKLITIY